MSESQRGDSSPEKRTSRFGPPVNIYIEGEGECLGGTIPPDTLRRIPPEWLSPYLRAKRQELLPTNSEREEPPSVTPSEYGRYLDVYLEVNGSEGESQGGTIPPEVLRRIPPEWLSPYLQAKQKELPPPTKPDEKGY